MLMMTCKTMEK